MLQRDADFVPVLCGIHLGPEVALPSPPVIVGKPVAHVSQRRNGDRLEEPQAGRGHVLEEQGRRGNEPGKRDEDVCRPSDRAGDGGPMSPQRSREPPLDQDAETLQHEEPERSQRPRERDGGGAARGMDEARLEETDKETDEVGRQGALFDMAVIQQVRRRSEKVEPEGLVPPRSPEP